MPIYGDAKYWDDRYRKDEGKLFDWLESWQTIKELLQVFMTRESTIINLGCGNSRIHEEMYDDGYHHILNVDISGVVINSMAMWRPEMNFLKMDVTDMTSLEPESFDVALDKSTIDALLCSAGS